MNQLSPASQRRARFATLVFQERTRQESRWSAEHDAQHTRLEWAGLLAHYACQVWSSATPCRALVQLAALALAIYEVLDKGEGSPTPTPCEDTTPRAPRPMRVLPKMQEAHDE